MGMFGGHSAPENQRISAPKRGFDDVGGIHDSLRALAASLMNANGSGAGNPLSSLVQQRQQDASQADFRNRQLDVQRLIAGQRADTEPAVIKALRAANIDPTSPQGQAIIQNNLNRPIIAGSPEGGFTAMGGAFGMPAPQPQANGPQIGTVEDGYVFMGGDPASPTSWKKQ